MLPYKTPLLFLFVLLLASSVSYSQVYGCKDPNATNYNPSATVTDTSCVYPNTSYVPPIHLNPINDTLIENSGLQWAGNSLWTFNDSGNEPALYRISTTEVNRILQIVTLEGTTNVDWEDIAFDGTYFYIGDFGNNVDGTRTDLRIYKFPFSAIDADYNVNRNVTIPSSQISTIQFSYSNRGTIIPASANNTKFDCEAMIVDGGKIHLFSKNWIDLTTTHYQINDVVAGTYIADSIETLPVSYLVTGADITPNGKVIVLLGYQTTGFANHFMHLLSDYTGGLYFNGNRRKINLPDAFSIGQAEGICFTDNTSGYISNEGVTSPISITQKLRSFNTSSFIAFSILPARLLNFRVSKRNGQHQLSWAFTEQTEKLKIIRVSAGNGAEEIAVGNSAVSGTYTISIRSVSDCYKLSWQEANGRVAYSHTICLKDYGNNMFEQVMLKRSGQLSFQFNGKASNYNLRVIGADGRLTAQAYKFVTPGSTTTQLSKSLNSGIYILQFIGKENQTTISLQVH